MIPGGGEGGNPSASLLLYITPCHTWWNWWEGPTLSSKTHSHLHFCMSNCFGVLESPDYLPLLPRFFGSCQKFSVIIYRIWNHKSLLFSKRAYIVVKGSTNGDPGGSSVPHTCTSSWRHSWYFVSSSVVCGVGVWFVQFIMSWLCQVRVNYVSLDSEKNILFTLFYRRG